MRIRYLICLALAVASTALAQNPSNHKLPDLPEEPREMLAVAAPLYNFDEPAMTPWYLKGTYEIYDSTGSLTAQGVYEHWWMSPKVSRSSWTRSAATRTEWHNADGTAEYRATGNRLFFLEHKLDTLLFSPFMDSEDLNVPSVKVDKDSWTLGKIKLPCGVFMAPGGRTTYCFDASAPLLRIKMMFNNAIIVQFDHLVETENRVLAQQITITNGIQTLLTFTVDTVSNFPPKDSTLAPPLNAKQLDFALWDLQSFPPSVSVIKRETQYPLAGQASQPTGTVGLDVLIGKDGRVSDARVLYSPSFLLNSSVREMVMHWQFTPYIVEGKPQEINTIIRVTFPRRR